MTTGRRPRLTYSLGLALQLLFIFSHDSQILALENDSVKLVRLDDGHVVMSNGIVNVTLTVPNGDIDVITYRGSDNLLESNYTESERGRWNVVWNGLGNKHNAKEKIFDGLPGQTYKVIEQSENQVEISFRSTWDASASPSTRVPLNYDKRYVMLRGTHGFYSYCIFEHPKESPAFGVQVGRLVLKLEPKKFEYMAISDVRQRYMPSANDRITGKPLDVKEAVLLLNPANPEFKGEVDDKYLYSCDNKDSQVHGWVSNDKDDAASIGFWMITPSNEFRAGGPLKQDLTSHVGTTVLSVFNSRHFVGDDIDLKFESGEYWKKVIGPVFVYLNSHQSPPHQKNNPFVLWEDAKRTMEKEVGNWPYKFPMSSDYLKSDQRATVSGTFLLHDRLIDKEAVPANSAYVGLATPGPPGSWQIESKCYQFWTQTDQSGKFLIKNVVPGVYTLFGWVNGTLGEYVHPSNITITKGSSIDMASVVFEPPRRGHTLWEIGIPDRKATEFFFPTPSPQYKIHKYGNFTEKVKQYGLWERYTDLYPKNDLIFTIGSSDYKKDWFYAHVIRVVKADQFERTTWQIQFNLDTINTNANYTLQLALASANNADVEVRINDSKSPPHFTAVTHGKDNAVARYGDHGIYHFYSIDVEGRSLVKGGMNTVYLTPTNDHKYTEIMYDYIRFEGSR